MKGLRKYFKDKFDWDVSDLPEYTKETMPNVITDLIQNSEFLSKLNLREGIKGREDINLLNGDVELQAKQGCSVTPDGAFIFTNKTLEVVPLTMSIEFCNENLNGTVAEILNSFGMKGQNDHIPTDIQDVIMAYLLKLLQRKAQRLVVLGDTTSIVPELQHLNGLVYLINNDVEVIDYMSSEASISSTNAYAIAYGLFKAIPVELFDNGETVEIFMGRDKALLVLEDWNNANPYSQVPIPASKGSSMEFTLPLTNVQVVSIPELNNTNHMFAFPTRLVFLGTDSKEDWNFSIKYNEYDDLLKAEASFRIGIQEVWGQYFTRLQLAVS